MPAEYPVTIEEKFAEIVRIADISRPNDCETLRQMLNETLPTLCRIYAERQHDPPDD
jgi:hypothetical protein